MGNDVAAISSDATSSWTLLPQPYRDAGTMNRVCRWRLLRVQGPSMSPTLRHGDVILVRRVSGDGRLRRRVGGVPGLRASGDRRAPLQLLGTVQEGQVVTARFRSMPAILVTKRAAAAVDGGWRLRSDNPFAGGDSTQHGVADVDGVVLLRWHRRLIWPRLVRRDRSGPTMTNGA